jgi:hypothetical protein
MKERKMLRKSVILLVVGLFMFAVPALASDVSTGTGVGVIDGQGQGQGQGQSIDDHSVNEAMDSRPNAGPVPIPGQPGWFTTPTPDGSFQSLKTILQFGDVFTEGALEEMAGGKVDVRYMVTNDKNEVARAKFGDNLKRKIKIVIAKPEGAKFIAFANGNAKNGKTGSVQVMAAIALDALKDGANVVYFTAEGAHRKVDASGWGIGISGTTTSEHSMTTPGMGYSAGKSGPEDMPWLQGAAFVDPKLQLPDSVRVQDQTGNHRFTKVKVIKIVAKKAPTKKAEVAAFVPSTGNIAGQ